MAIHLGPHRIDGKVFLAPMAGVTDVPFRQICRAWGASYVVGEMVASQAHLWASAKSQARFRFEESDSLRVTQLLGADPDALEKAVDFAVEQGAQVIDFNMGCPAKKVCSVACGSALMKDEAEAQVLLKRLGEAARGAGVPVTLKCRTGWDESHKNAVTIAKMAADEGFSMITVHGRTRAGGYISPVEYDTIADVVRAVSIPVVANGDSVDGERARRVLDSTGAAAVMVGRASMGNPWIFRQIATYLEGQTWMLPDYPERVETILAHWQAHFAFYEEDLAVRTFRKHLSWYLQGWPNVAAALAVVLREQTGESQRQRLCDYFVAQGWM